jgi:hypothetical protein
LHSILNGADSFELRIWLVEALVLPKNVLVFRKNISWSGSHYNSYNLPLIKSDGGVAHISGRIPVGDSVFLVKEFTPACGWQLFEDSLNYFEIERMSTQHLIPHFSPHVVMDGHGYDVEISTRISYRYLHFWIPENYNDSTNRRFVQFIKMVKRQLGKNYYWPSDQDYE